MQRRELQPHASEVVKGTRKLTSGRGSVVFRDNTQQIAITRRGLPGFPRVEVVSTPLTAPSLTERTVIHTRPWGKRVTEQIINPSGHNIMEVRQPDASHRTVQTLSSLLARSPELAEITLDRFGRTPDEKRAEKKIVHTFEAEVNRLLDSAARRKEIDVIPGSSGLHMNAQIPIFRAFYKPPTNENRQTTFINVTDIIITAGTNLPMNIMKINGNIRLTHHDGSWSDYSVNRGHITVNTIKGDESSSHILSVTEASTFIDALKTLHTP